MRYTRRYFAKSSALLAAGVFTGKAAALSRLANAQLQVGVVGVGNYGAVNLAAIARHARVVALCDVDQSYLAPAADRHSDAKAFRDMRELLQLKELDAVVISTPDHLHAYATLHAIDRGLHVFCEKPLTHSSTELHRLVIKAEERNVITQTGLQHHLSRGAQRAIAMLRSGELGEVHEVHAWTNRPIWPQGVDLPRDKESVPKALDWDLWLGPAPARPFHSVYHPLRWRGWHRYGSGALGDYGPHLLAAVFFGLDLSVPLQFVPQTSERFEHSFPAASKLTCTFQENNQRPAITLFWYDGGNLPPKHVTGVATPPPNGVMVVGEHGKLFIPEHGGEPRSIGYKSKLKSPGEEQTPKDIYENWVHGCLTQQATCLPFSAVASLMQTCLLGNVALRHGTSVTWNAKERAITPPEAAAFLGDEYRDGWQLPD